MSLSLFMSFSLFCHFLQCNLSSDLFSLCVDCFPPNGSLLCDIPFVGSAPLNSTFSLPPAVWLVFAHWKFTKRIWGAAFRRCSAGKQKQLLHGVPHQHLSTPRFPFFSSASSLPESALCYAPVSSSQPQSFPISRVPQVLQPLTNSPPPRLFT